MKQLVAWYSRDNDTWSSHTRYNTQIICISFENEYGVCRKWLRFLIFESRRNVYFRKEIRSSLISALSFIKILITYFTCIESNRISFFFKSFQILSNPWWYFDNRFWNVDPSQLVTHREFERRTLLIGWNFVPRFENSRRPIAFSLLGFYSLIFQARDIVLLCEWNLREWKLFGKWSMKVEWMRAASLILKSLTRWYLLWIWRRKRKNRVR